ncbi:hypothetical protein, partial [Schlesneria sp.]|uniref:hypothetical protein n=1 Tax=Schlesneria sp. TaxID=2762018 RepID=UPI002EE1EDD6
KEYALPKLEDWDQFEGFVMALQKLGWTPTKKFHGPDARCWAFTRDADSLWLVFNDILGGSLKSENQAMDLETVAAQLNSAFP